MPSPQEEAWFDDRDRLLILLAGSSVALGAAARNGRALNTAIDKFLIGRYGPYVGRLVKYGGLNLSWIYSGVAPFFGLPPWIPMQTVPFTGIAALPAEAAYRAAWINKTVRNAAEVASKLAFETYHLVPNYFRQVNADFTSAAAARDADYSRWAIERAIELNRVTGGQAARAAALAGSPLVPLGPPPPPPPITPRTLGGQFAPRNTIIPYVAPNENNWRQAAAAWSRQLFLLDQEEAFLRGAERFGQAPLRPFQFAGLPGPVNVFDAASPLPQTYIIRGIPTAVYVNPTTIQIADILAAGGSPVAKTLTQGSNLYVFAGTAAHVDAMAAIGLSGIGIEGGFVFQDAAGVVRIVANHSQIPDELLRATYASQLERYRPIVPRQFTAQLPVDATAAQRAEYFRAINRELYPNAFPRAQPWLETPAGQAYAGRIAELHAANIREAAMIVARAEASQLRGPLSSRLGLQTARDLLASEGRAGIIALREARQILAAAPPASSTPLPSVRFLPWIAAVNPTTGALGFANVQGGRLIGPLALTQISGHGGPPLPGQEIPQATGREVVDFYLTPIPGLLWDLGRANDERFSQRLISLRLEKARLEIVARSGANSQPNWDAAAIAYQAERRAAFLARQFTPGSQPLPPGPGNWRWNGSAWTPATGLPPATSPGPTNPPPALAQGLELLARRLAWEQEHLPLLQSLKWPMKLSANPTRQVSKLFGEPISGSLPMTLFKGTVDFNSLGWGGWSESVYSDVPAETSQTMMAKMVQWLGDRMKLSVGAENTGCTNPVQPYALRVEDELVLRDAFTQYCLPVGATPVAGSVVTPNGYTTGAVRTNVNNQNLDMQLGSRVKVTSGIGAQIASPMFHGVPTYALSQAGADFSAAFLRTANPGGPYLTAMANMFQRMALNGLGYRNITGAWNGPNNVPGPGAAPMDWYYNPSVEMIELQWKSPQWPGSTFVSPGGGLPPICTVPGAYTVGSPALGFPAGVVAQASSVWPFINAKCRLQIRGWKGFAVLNGRYTAQVVQPYSLGTAPNSYSSNLGPYNFALRILRKVRQPQDSSVPFVSPIAWTVWWPGEGLAGGGNVLPGNAQTNTVTGAVPAGYASWQDFFKSVAQYQYIQSKKLGRIWGSERGRQRNRAS